MLIPFIQQAFPNAIRLLIIIAVRDIAISLLIKVLQLIGRQRLGDQITGKIRCRGDADQTSNAFRPPQRRQQQKPAMIARLAK